MIITSAILNIYNYNISLKDSLRVQVVNLLKIAQFSSFKSDFIRFDVILRFFVKGMPG